jgi:hypothetical protein
MKLADIEDAGKLATKEDLHEIQLQIRELRVEIKEMRVHLESQIQGIKVLIWLPVVTGVVQILIVLLRH